MFEDNEKDFIIDSDGEIKVDDLDSISWDETLNEAQKSDVVSIKDTSSKDEVVDGKLINLGDELELVSDDEEAADAELNRILKEDSSPKQKAFDAFGVNNDESNQNDINNIDIDSALQGLDETASDTPIFDESEVKDDKIISRKEEIGIKQQKSSISPVLVAVLFFVIVVAGVYYYITFFQDNDTPIVKENVQEQLNNTTAEQIEQRNPDDIDVVNEEQGEKLTTDEIKENEENQKKEIVAIIPTGRDNPFMPLGKYIQQPERIIAYDKVNIPKPPKDYGVVNDIRDKMLTIAVSGIMYDEQKPSAIITLDNNDYFVQRGDRLDDYRVLDITRNAVIISYGKDIYRANVGEEFKITTKFEGNAQFLAAKQGGGKQYYSVNSLSADNQNAKQKPPSYISENEIQVNAR